MSIYSTLLESILTSYLNKQASTAALLKNNMLIKWAGRRGPGGARGRSVARRRANVRARKLANQAGTRMNFNEAMPRNTYYMGSPETFTARQSMPGVSGRVKYVNPLEASPTETGLSVIPQVQDIRRTLLQSKLNKPNVIGSGPTIQLGTNLPIETGLPMETGLSVVPQVQNIRRTLLQAKRNNPNVIESGPAIQLGTNLPTETGLSIIPQVQNIRRTLMEAKLNNPNVIESGPAIQLGTSLPINAQRGTSINFNEPRPRNIYNMEEPSGFTARLSRPGINARVKNVQPRGVEPVVEPTVSPAVEPTVRSQYPSEAGAAYFRNKGTAYEQALALQAMQHIKPNKTAPAVEPTVSPVASPAVSPAVEPTVSPVASPAVEPTVRPLYPSEIGAAYFRNKGTEYEKAKAERAGIALEDARIRLELKRRANEANAGMPPTSGPATNFNPAPQPATNFNPAPQPAPQPATNFNPAPQPARPSSWYNVNPVDIASTATLAGLGGYSGIKGIEKFTDDNFKNYTVDDLVNDYL